MTASCQSKSHPFNTQRTEMAVPFTCMKCKRDFCAMCEGYYYETGEWDGLCDGCETPEKQARIPDFDPTPLEAPPEPAPKPPPVEAPMLKPVALEDLSLKGTLSVLRTPSRLQQQFENGTDRAFRHRIIRALEIARTRVSRGDPSLRTALHYARLHARLDEESARRFDLIVAKARKDYGTLPAAYPEPKKGESSEDLDLRIAVKDAIANQSRGAFWQPGRKRPLHRPEAVCMLTLALLRAKTAPFRYTFGPLFQDDAIPLVKK